MYRELTEKMIKTYGRSCEILPFGTSSKIEVRAFINPLLYKNKMYVSGEYIPDGFCDGGHYLYVGEARVSLDDMPIGTVVKCGNNRYTIKHSEQYFIDDHPIYSWAILQLRRRGKSGA